MTNVINLKDTVKKKARNNLAKVANRETGSEKLTNLLVKLVETMDKKEWKKVKKVNFIY